jgi:hypothetical protein
MTLDLADDEKDALAELLRRTIDEDRFPMSPRLAPLKAILSKIERPELRPDLPPPLKAHDAPRATRKRRR